MTPVDPAVRELVERFVNREATPEQFERLQELLLQSEATRDFYLEYVNLHASLRRRFFSLGDEGVDCTATEEANPARKITDASSVAGSFQTGRSFVFLVAGMVGLVSLVIGLGPYFSIPARDEQTATVRLVEGEVTHLSSAGSGAAKSGDRLRPGESLRVEGEEGRAAIEYADGTLIRLKGGSLVRVPANGAVRLDLLAGSMDVDGTSLSQDPPIFTTEHSRYVALGTHFRLYHDEAASRLEIERGKVRLERPARGESVEVEAGSVAIAANETPIEVKFLAPGRADLKRTLSRAGQHVAFADGDKRLVTSSWETGLKVWVLREETPKAEYRRDAGRSDGLAVTGAESTVFQVNRNGYLLAWRTEQTEAIQLPLLGTHTRSRCISPDGTTVAESSQEGTSVYRIDLEGSSLRERRTFNLEGKTWCMALSPRGNRLAAGVWDGTVRVLEVDSGEVLWERRLQHTPTHIDLTASGRRLIVFTQKDGIKQFDLASGEQWILAEPGLGLVRCLQFDRAGRYVLAGLNDRTARIWSAEDGRPLLVIDAGHAPQGIAWSEAEQMLATADGDVKLWKCNLNGRTGDFQ